jgi:hypothetical protein
MKQREYIIFALQWILIIPLVQYLVPGVHFSCKPYNLHWTKIYSCKPNISCKKKSCVFIVVVNHIIDQIGQYSCKPKISCEKKSCVCLICRIIMYMNFLHDVIIFACHSRFSLSPASSKCCFSDNWQPLHVTNTSHTVHAKRFLTLSHIFESILHSVERRCISNKRTNILMRFKACSCPTCKESKRKRKRLESKKAEDK